MFDIDSLIRKNIRELVPYASARSEFSGRGAILLDANENPFNRPFNRYPDPLQLELKEQISKLKGPGVDKIFAGNGSDEAIDLLFRAFCEPSKDNVVIPEPTYGMYEVCARINDIQVKSVLLKEDFSLNAKAVLDAADQQTKLIFLCSPNNPTANSYAEPEITGILNNFRGLVVLDEAYIDFAPHDGFLQHIGDFPNLVILQTLSKAWGLAGIRLGLAFADEAIIHVMNRIKYPYNVNALTLSRALQALECRSEPDMWTNSILSQKKILTENLRRYPFVQKIYPSDANFLLVRVEDADRLYDFLLQDSMIVRNRSKLPLCEHCIRITVGTELENKNLIDRLNQYIPEKQLKRP
jgi:histidinol-phosphate aminotransferase